MNIDGTSLHLPTQLDPAIEARMLVAQAGGTRVSRGWTIGATADICGLDHEPSRPPTPAVNDHALVAAARRLRTAHIAYRGES